MNVEAMFDTISPTYDSLNHILSFGLDFYWRKKMSAFLPDQNKVRLLDCATGTGDQLFSLMNTGLISQAVGIDFSKEMIARAKKKNRFFMKEVSFQVASAMDLPFADETFDAVSISFGLRNVENPLVGLKEMHRTLAPKGRLLVLEFSLPKNKHIKKFHLKYLRSVVPKIGGLISKERSAYTYLQETIESFPHGSALCSLITEAGFKGVTCYPLTFGIVSIYTGDKI